MKKMKLLLIILVSLYLNSCEQVVDIDLNTASPKLVIEAPIVWQKGTTGDLQKIKLTTTADYYTNATPVVSGAIVSIKDSDNTIFNFIETPNTGEYICSNFIPVIDKSYTLTIIHNGQTYSGTETLKSVAPIKEIIQNSNGGLAGNELQIKTVYIDPANTENYYLYKYKYLDQVKPDYYSDEDTFFQGNPFFSVSFKENLKPGDKIEITHTGISKKYYNYITVLLGVSGNSGGGPFQAPPATVRGNMLNNTNPENFPFGYFSISETDSRTYTVQ
jgi:hypothetical protein